MKRQGRTYAPAVGGPHGSNLNDVMEPWSIRKDNKNTPAAVLDEASFNFGYDVLP